jgi:hypothetical protein
LKALFEMMDGMDFVDDVDTEKTRLLAMSAVRAGA